MNITLLGTIISLQQGQPSPRATCISYAARQAIEEKIDMNELCVPLLQFWVRPVTKNTSLMACGGKRVATAAQRQNVIHHIMLQRYISPIVCMYNIIF